MNLASFSTVVGLRHYAERWLTPGTEYAVPEKLPLPREWYSEWDRNGACAAPTNGTASTGAGGTDVDESSERVTFSSLVLSLIACGIDLRLCPAYESMHLQL